MRSSLWIASALVALVSASPSYNIGAASTSEMKIISEYFQVIGSKVLAGKAMSQEPVCDLSAATMPAAPTPLPNVSEGLSLKHVAIGRGTQNYTCSTTNSSAAPVAVGAVATLFNATCVASTYPSLLSLLPSVALTFNLTSAEQECLSPTNLIISGHHFFETTTTPFFNLDTSAMELGTAPCAKNASTAAPADANPGQGGVGNGAVAWLKLTTKEGATGGLEEIYRVNTAGGNPPDTCEGMAAAFEVQYAAEYWFYQV